MLTTQFRPPSETRLGVVIDGEYACFLNALFTDIADAIREKTGDTGTIVADEFHYYIRDYLQKITPKPYLTFKSHNSFSVSTTKGWNGIMEYSTDASTWAEWDGSEISAEQDGEYKLYFRGTGNTKVAGSSDNS